MRQQSKKVMNLTYQFHLPQKLKWRYSNHKKTGIKCLVYSVRNQEWFCSNKRDQTLLTKMNHLKKWLVTASSLKRIITQSKTQIQWFFILNLIGMDGALHNQKGSLTTKVYQHLKPDLSIVLSIVLKTNWKRNKPNVVSNI
jgi:hypothetical protein